MDPRAQVTPPRLSLFIFLPLLWICLASISGNSSSLFLLGSKVTLQLQEHSLSYNSHLNERVRIFSLLAVPSCGWQDLSS